MHSFIILIFILGLGAKLWAAENPHDISFKCFPNAEVMNRGYKKNLMIIHSYGQDYVWTRSEHTGIQKVLPQLTGWNIHVRCLHTKKYIGPQLDVIGNRIKREFEIISPDAIILTDDFAVKIIYPLAKRKGIPVSVGGVNGEMSDYGYSPTDKYVTGTLENANITAALKIAKRLLPSANRIVFVTDGDITGNAILNQDIESFRNARVFSEYVVIQPRNVEALKNQLSVIDHKKNVVVISSYYNFYDAKGQHVSYRSIVKWMSNHTSLLDIGHSDFHVKEGHLMSLSNSASEIGEYTAKSLVEGLKDPSSFKKGIRSSAPVKVNLNMDRAKKIGLEIPFDLLIYYEDARGGRKR